MQLIDIDKARYRKHLNIVIVGFISSLLVMSLLFGTILISWFSNVSEVNALVEAATDVITDGVKAEPETNFKYNLLGVILALLGNAAILHSIKNSEFFKEVYYVWQVKQLQNLVYRKLKKIKLAAKEGEENALIILSFYYQSQIQIYNLDDNTITLSSIEQHLQKVNDMIATSHLTIDAAQFEKSLLASY
ncbi:DUF3087 family protein [Colwellia psychrerythraea]|uniref:DUF3087 domain-containing protein n=1 Tax=Colwellia psychrerythraea TaxID=28229 RepID=A0A099KSZ8_COLPS|nr:DUF3087 family protein [Colwellia psychrerythraea]KGJ92793.1 Protein of unknown function DUF3087 [Colwellia psychrerythraea]